MAHAPIAPILTSVSSRDQSDHEVGPAADADDSSAPRSNWFIVDMLAGRAKKSFDRDSKTRHRAHLSPIFGTFTREFRPNLPIAYYDSHLRH